MRVIGDRDRFAIGFELRDDPDSSGDPVARSSWGGIQLWVAGRNLTAGRAADDSSVDVAEVPLAPVVRWLVTHWDPLLHEERLPRESGSSNAATWRMDVLGELPQDDATLDSLMTDRDAWWQRHGLGAALPEFRVPDVHLRRAGSSVEVSWDDREWRSVPGGVRLIESPGAVLLPAREVAEVLHRWASEVVDALEDSAECREFVREMRTALDAMARPGPGISRLRWAAGQHLEQAAARIRELAGVKDGVIDDTVRALLGIERDPAPGLVTPLTVPVLIYRSANPDLSSADLTELLALTKDAPGDLGHFAPHQSPSLAPKEPQAATEDGYEKALAFRAELGVPEDAPLQGDLDLEERILRRLGVTVADIRLDDRHTDGVAVCSSGRAPLIAVNLSGRFSATAWGRRMTLAHELCHLLHDVDDEGQVGIASNPWAPPAAERRANAFAAMLLLSPTALGALLPRDSSQWTPRMLTEAMSTLGVGKSTLTWHLYNLRWITYSEREAWLDGI